MALKQWHDGARLGGAMQTFLCLGFHSLRKNEERRSATTLERVRAATGFDTITTVGPYSIRNPLTNRINRLETERDVLRFEECTEVMVGRARFLHQGLDLSLIHI